MSESELSFLAFYDPLTGLYKRSRFTELAKRLLEQSRLLQSFCTVHFLDLNGFKAINDAAGHQTGDEALRLVARKLREASGPGDLIGRYGGDEFFVFVCRPGLAQVLSAGQTLALALRFDFEVGGRSFPLSAALGTAYGDNETLTIDQLIDRADRAMYMHKAQSKESRAAMKAVRS